MVSHHFTSLSSYTCELSNWRHRHGLLISFEPHQSVLLKLCSDVANEETSIHGAASTPDPLPPRRPTVRSIIVVSTLFHSVEFSDGWRTEFACRCRGNWVMKSQCIRSGQQKHTHYLVKSMRTQLWDQARDRKKCQTTSGMNDGQTPSACATVLHMKAVQELYHKTAHGSEHH